jgi:murein DD-endopeptidase
MIRAHMGRRIITALLALALAACAALPGTPDETAAPASDLAARQAEKLVGAPYRLGGASPGTGFDCSGLVQYAFRQAGIALPRSTEGQLRASAPVARSALRAGDALFFDLDGRKKSHVGLYLGNGRFVHAPSTGKQVRIDSLDSRFWSRQFSEARRF